MDRKVCRNRTNFTSSVKGASSFERSQIQKKVHRNTEKSRKKQRERYVDSERRIELRALYHSHTENEDACMLLREWMVVEVDGFKDS